VQARVEVVGRLTLSGDRRRIPVLLSLAKSYPDADVRLKALEGLGYYGRRRAIPILISASHEADPYLRFWAVHALGCARYRGRPRRRDRVFRALEARLLDLESPNRLWPIGWEALAALKRETAYRQQFEAKLRLAKVGSESERRWWGMHAPIAP
jgi:HEAT repeat protein